MKAYYARLTSDDAKVRAEAGRAWSRWEMATSRVQVDAEYLDRAEDADFADKFARIEVRAIRFPLLHLWRVRRLIFHAPHKQPENRPTTLSTAPSCRTGNCSKSPRLTRSDTSRPSSSKVAGTVSAPPRRPGTCTARGPKPSLCVASPSPSHLRFDSHAPRTRKTIRLMRVRILTRLPCASQSQVMVADAGHSANEPGIEKALLEATAEFAKLS